MKKRLASLVIVMCIMAGFAPWANAEIVTYGSLRFDMEKGIITKCDKDATGELVIPSEINGVTVTGIGYRAFEDCKSITSVILPDSVTDIEFCAFQNCSSLTSISLPNGISAINSSTFKSCSSLSDISLPYGVTFIGEQAFSSCSSLRHIDIPDTVTAIGKSAFNYCTELTDITIPESVTNIGGWAFSQCKKLEMAEIKGNVDAIEDCVFSNTAIKHIDIPDSATKIGREAFVNCENLESVNIGKNVTRIEQDAFTACKSLKEITIPNSVDYLGTYAFNWCSGLKSVKLSRNISSILDHTFENCTNLRHIELHEGITNICNSAFSYCSSLEDITIPSTVTDIGVTAFGNCVNITSITLPAKVRSIGLGAFSDCKALASIQVSDDNDVYCSVDGVLYNKSLTTLLQYPPAKKGSCYTVPNTVTDIAGGITPNSGAFGHSKYLEEISLPYNLKEIKERTFYGCEKLKSLVIPQGVTVIDAYALAFNPELKILSIPNSVTTFNNDISCGSSNISDIYFGGTQSRWSDLIFKSRFDAVKAVYDGSINQELTNATLHYESAYTPSPSSSEPTIEPALTPAPTIVPIHDYNVSIGSVAVTPNSAGFHDIDVTLSNDIPENGSAKLIAAAYNGGKLVDVAVTDIYSGDDYYKQLQLYARHADYVKLFIWKDLTDMRPLCDATVIYESDFLKE